jgi:predicted naringenin-chalcone synthase
MASYPNPHGTCPIDIIETAEAYIMKRLSTADALRFAIHCLTCRHCAAATEEAESFVRAMKAAAQQFKVDRPPLCSHATVTNVITVRPGVVRAKMRFEVISG